MYSDFNPFVWLLIPKKSWEISGKKRGKGTQCVTTGMPAKSRAVGRPINLGGGAIIIQGLLMEKGLLQNCLRGNFKICPLI